MAPLSKKQFYLVLIAAFALFLLGVFANGFWNALYYPMKPLYVELVNDTDKIIPTVEIEHGSSGLQEKILIVRLKPHEHRVLALNHKPGMGFNVAAHFDNGEKTEICGGKSKEYGYFRETITRVGIYTTPIR